MSAFIKNNRFLSAALLIYGLGIHNVSPYMFVIIFVYYLLSGIKPKFDVPQILSLLALISSAVTMDLFYINFFIKIFAISLVATMIPQKEDTNLFSCFEIIALAYALQLILVYCYNLSVGTITTRSLIHYSSGEMTSATGLACMLVPYCSLLPLFLYNRSLKSKGTILFLILYVLILYINLILAGRTFLVLTVISVIYGFIASYIFNVGVEKKKLLKRTFCVAIIVSIIVSVFFTQISEIVLGSNFYKRFFSNGQEAIGETPRSEIVAYYISHFKDAIWGGGYIREQLHGMMSHTLWLDVLDMQGLLTFLIICLMTLYSWRIYFKSCLDRGRTASMRVVFSSILLIFNIQFCLEPIIEGSPFLFEIYWLIVCMLQIAYHGRIQSIKTPRLD